MPITQEQINAFKQKYKIPEKKSENSFNNEEVDNRIKRLRELANASASQGSSLTNAPQTNQQETKKEGFLGGALKSIFKPITAGVSSGLRSIQATPDIAKALFGDKKAIKSAQKTMQKPVGEFKTLQSMSAKEQAGLGLQTAANLIPGAGAGANLLTKVGVGAATGYAFDVSSKLQENKSLGESFKPGIGTVIGGALPVAGAGLNVAKNIVGRLFKGLGSKLSGASEGAIDSIIANPSKAFQVTKELSKKGNYRVLEQNAKSIMDGVAKVRKEASIKYGKGLESLSKEDIDPSIFRGSIKPFFDKYKIASKNGKRVFGGVEFRDIKSLRKANDLINKIATANINRDGKNFRTLLKDIEDAKFRTTANSAERLSFNAFLNDMSGAIKTSINRSTGKLTEINNAYSRDMQLVEAMENIFGKVNYRNLPEVVKMSQKLEGLFNQKGLAPEVLDDFFKRIGLISDDIRVSEAVRQITQKAGQANTMGTSGAEIIQAVTSAAVTPKAVMQLSILTGWTKEASKVFLGALTKLDPQTRNVLIQTVLNLKGSQEQDQAMPTPTEF